MNEVFADTSGWASFLREQERHHVKAVTRLYGMKAQCFSYGMKFRPLGKDQTPKINLTFGLKCGIIRVSSWQT